MAGESWKSHKNTTRERDLNRDHREQVIEAARAERRRRQRALDELRILAEDTLDPECVCAQQWGWCCVPGHQAELDAEAGR